jgi:hypothetical protein
VAKRIKTVRNGVKTLGNGMEGGPDHISREKRPEISPKGGA